MATSDTNPQPDVDAYTVRDFCRRHGGISLAHFYALRARGQGPAIMKLGSRTLVSRESAAAWRRAREKAAALKKGAVT